MASSTTERERDEEVAKRESRGAEDRERDLEIRG
jgi:hypothetical protein